MLDVNIIAIIIKLVKINRQEISNCVFRELYKSVSPQLLEGGSDVLIVM